MEGFNKNELSRILVAGANGFIGSRLSETLLAKGFWVKTLSRYNFLRLLELAEDISYLASKIGADAMTFYIAFELPFTIARPLILTARVKS